MTRVVHKVSRMIACHIDGRALLLMESDFTRLVERLLPDLSSRDRAAFHMATTSNLAFFGAKENAEEWELLFRDRLISEMKAGKFRPLYTLTDKEARDYVEEFLEAYRVSFKHINVAAGMLHDKSDAIFNISLCAKQSLIDRLLKRYGKAYDELNIVKGRISKISGSSLNFKLTADGKKYHFAPTGVRRL